jgi:hypothetical protein
MAKGAFLDFASGFFIFDFHFASLSAFSAFSAVKNFFPQKESQENSWLLPCSSALLHASSFKASRQILPKRCAIDRLK